MPALLAITGVFVYGGGVERTLHSDVRTALGKAGYHGVVAVDGRSVVVSEVSPRSVDAVRAVVSDVNGVGGADVRVAEPEQLLVAVRGGEILVSGAVADDAERRALLEAVRSDGHRVTAALRLGGLLPIPPAVIGRVLSAALSAKVSDVTTTIHNGQVVIAARVPDEARATAVRDAVREAANGLQVTDRIEVGSSAPVGDLNVQALHDSISRLVNGNGAIRFVQGTTAYEGHGPVLIERVGRMLLVGPRASITLVAHGTEQAVATKRGELVRDVLVGQGVAPALIAIETRPAPDGEYDPATRQVDVVVR
ncbi:peptidoglycan-binding protein ArfA [Lentzea albidocapillata subsp. violacea]|uniref:Peptidoglycan-binding protein ArfA n=1 Tax=Lentzea albidocapillata subsp. violacea TaxID=128104 RepID=A0A1G8QV30_9PSEU|nr:peptidoglycan-binding protein ArfA [Lentzea albidocapillata subsp. violacea]